MENIINKFDGDFRFLSNFYECSINCLDDDYPSAEHAYQAMKSKDPEIRRQIKECQTPGQAKRLGNKIALRPNWDHMKWDIMLDIVASKFEQHPDLKEKLLSTGNSKLVEGNDWNDTYWGVCQGTGQNKLGEILMLIRSNFRKKI